MTRGMRLIRGREFLMGCDQAYPDEAPAHLATVTDFWIDETPVTNRQFAEFTAATGYKTLAETAPDPRDYPGMLPEMAKPASAVFVRPARRAEPAHPVSGGSTYSARTGAIRGARTAGSAASWIIRRSTSPMRMR